MKRLIKVTLTVLILMIFSSCEYKETMNDKEIDELVISMKEFVAADVNFVNFFKRSVDDGMLYEEEAENNEGLFKYSYSSKEIDRFFESGIMYTNNKVTNQKTKTAFQFDNLTFVDNIHYELSRIKLFLKKEYISKVTGSIFSTESYKSIYVEIQPQILFNDGLVSQEYSSIDIFAEFDMNNNLSNVGIIYRDIKNDMVYYETGPKLNWDIEFTEDFSNYQ